MTLSPGTDTCPEANNTSKILIPELKIDFAQLEKEKQSLFKALESKCESVSEVSFL